MDTYQTIRGVRSFLQYVKPGMVYQTRVRSCKPDVYARRCRDRDRPYLGRCHGCSADYAPTDTHYKLFVDLWGWLQRRAGAWCCVDAKLDDYCENSDWLEELERIGWYEPARLIQFALRVHRQLFRFGPPDRACSLERQGYTPRQAWHRLRERAYWQDTKERWQDRGGFELLVRRAVAELGGAA